MLRQRRGWVCSVLMSVCVSEKIERTVQIEASTVEIEERGVKLRLTVVDTPGYGDAINSQDWYTITELCVCVHACVRVCFCLVRARSC